MNLLAVVVLQICNPNTSGFDYLLQFEFIKAATCTYANPAGMLVTGVFAYGAIAVPIYIKTGSAIIPFVLLLTIGGAAMTQMAGIVVPYALLLLLVTGAGILAILLKKFSR